MATATTLDKGHGRCERRTLKATTAWNASLDWPGVAEVGQVESVVVKIGTTTTEVRSFLTSVPGSEANAGQLLDWVRGRWSIENRSHYVRDVTMGEDASRVRTGSVSPSDGCGADCDHRVPPPDRRDHHRGGHPQRDAYQLSELFTKLGIVKQ